MAFDSRQDYILDTTTNQKHLGVAEEDKNRTRDRWGVQGKRDSIILRANKFGGDKNLKFKIKSLLIYMIK